MTLKTTLIRPLMAALSAGAIALSAMTSAGAATYVVAGEEYEQVEQMEGVQVAAADCYAIGQQVAAERGGDLLDARSANRNGREVCVIAVLVPGKGGKPARRVQVVVPAG